MNTEITTTKTTPTVDLSAKTEVPAVRTWNSPPADVLDKDGELRLVLDVPGANRTGLSVEVHDGVLEIEAQRADRPSHGYRRRFQLSRTVDPDGIEATLKHGVLTIDLPRKPEARPRRIEVRVG